MPNAKRFVVPVSALTHSRIPACLLAGMMLAGCGSMQSVVPHRIEPPPRGANNSVATLPPAAPAPPAPSHGPPAVTLEPGQIRPIPSQAPTVVIGGPPPGQAAPPNRPAPQATTTNPILATATIPQPRAAAAAKVPPPAPPRPAPEAAVTNPILATAMVPQSAPPATIVKVPPVPPPAPKPVAEAPVNTPVPATAAVPEAAPPVPAPVVKVSPPPPAQEAAVSSPVTAPAPQPLPPPASAPLVKEQPAAPAPAPAVVAKAAVPPPAVETPRAVAAAPPPGPDPYASKLAMLSSSNDLLATRVRPVDAPAPPPAVAAPVAAAAPPQQKQPAAAAVNPAPVPPPAPAAVTANNVAAASAPNSAVDPQTRALLNAVAAEQKPAALPPPVAAAPEPSQPRADAKLTSEADALANMPLPNLPRLAEQSPDTPPPTQVAQAETTIASAAPASGSGDATQLAQAELQQAQNRLDLSDAQVDRINVAQKRLASGDSAGALAVLQPLEQELETETRAYVVQGGESLWHVAGLQEVYGNSYLWPLIWEANKARVKQPYQLYKGLKLIFPAHPTAQQVAQALAYAKKNGAEGMKPGEP